MQRGLLIACPRKAARPASSGPPVVRKVDPTGNVSFAATGYFVSPRLRGQQIEVRLVGDNVQISQGGRLLRTLAGTARRHEGTRRLLDAERPTAPH